MIRYILYIVAGIIVYDLPNYRSNNSLLHEIFYALEILATPYQLVCKQWNKSNRIQLFQNLVTSLIVQIHQLIVSLTGSNFCSKFFNYFMPLVSFYTLLKTSENLKCSDVFRGYRKRLVA